MRRTDRLHTLSDRLRDGRLHRAADLARALGVSQRTVYRDVDALRDSGIPVEGTRGTGYRLAAPLALPPLDLTLVELEALHLGLAVVAEAADPELGAAARTLADRIDAALPNDEAPAADRPPLATYPLVEGNGGFRHLPTLRAAIRSRQKLRVVEEGGGRAATIRPLALNYQGRIWTLTAWCEQSPGFRTLRIDRIRRLEILPELFVDERGKTLDDHYGIADPG